ncbi:SGNH/GDSL hydrolase family protein [Nocardioides speluncae]|uniref:SGNH/GDSL hydrolase family protein n=1 Tax=Nocardioides speluncae TaxID=2670337 RepID=UPI000D68631B|nr:SGNH/GDSL hydrolase family protein [Nocardioides speluncae]
MSRRTSRTRIGSAFAALAAGAALLTTAPATAADDPPSYVALGDSFVSGPLIPNQVDLPCGRSDHNYPHLAAAAVGASLTDVSCGGARIQDMTGRQFPWTAPQFDALQPDTDIVTVGIGGNDLPFAEVVGVCGGLGALQPFGKPCTTYYNRGGVDELAQRMATQLEPRLTDVVKTIKQRSPQARVLFVGVPSVIPESGPSCWSLNVPIAPGDYPYLVKVTKNLNRTFAKAAANAGAEFVDIYPNSLGHDICKPIGVRWVEGIIPGAVAAPVHPNLLGMEGAAEVVAATIAG